MHRKPNRLTRAWTQVRYVDASFTTVVAFWGTVVAGSGFVAGFVWAKAI